MPSGVRAEFRPDTILAGNTEYQLIVTQAIHDVSGLALDSTMTIPFTTAAAGTTAVPPDSVSVPVPPDSVRAPVPTSTVRLLS